MRIGEVEIRKLNHASVLIKGSKIIYIDPFRINEKEPADIVLITHSHYDHCSPMDIQKIITPDTIIVTVADNQSKVCSLKFKHLKLVRPGEKFAIDSIRIETVAAYNTNKPFHSKENEWVGFIVEMDGQRIYHAGDTDLIPEMKTVKCDVALLPVSGTYVMTAAEAARAAELIKPKVAIPMHYGDIVGSNADAEAFRKACSCRVEL